MSSRTFLRFGVILLAGGIGLFFFMNRFMPSFAGMGFIPGAIGAGLIALAFLEKYYFNDKEDTDV